MTLIIHGQVQGVYFREMACALAKELGLVGTVENNPDGTVTIVAEGDRKILEVLRQWCKRGPEQAKVEGIEEMWEEIDQLSLPDFSSIYH